MAGAVIGHDAQDGDAEALEIGDGGLEEGHSTGSAFALPDLAEGHARSETASAAKERR